MHTIANYKKFVLSKKADVDWLIIQARLRAKGDDIHDVNSYTSILSDWYSVLKRRGDSLDITQWVTMVGQIAKYSKILRMHLAGVPIKEAREQCSDWNIAKVWKEIGQELDSYI